MTNSEPWRQAGSQSAADYAAIRIGDAERNSAVNALAEHMSTGRLDLDEYGTRSAVATSARTVGELRAVFADLPAPHPVLPGSRPNPLVGRPAGALADPGRGSGRDLVADGRSRAQKLVGAAAASSSILAVILFFVTGSWWWFLLIPLISSIATNYWGDSWKRPRH